MKSTNFNKLIKLNYGHKTVLLVESVGRVSLGRGGPITNHVCHPHSGHSVSLLLQSKNRLILLSSVDMPGESKKAQVKKYRNE